MTATRIPLIHGLGFLYTRLKGISWVASDGHLPTIIQRAAGDRLLQMIRTQRPSEPLFICCKHVVEVDDYAMQPIRDALPTTSRTVVFTDAEKIHKYLIDALGNALETKRLDSGGECMVYGRALPDSSKLWSVADALPDLEINHMKALVAGCFHKYEAGLARLPSTPILATGEFDARHVISDPDSFVWAVLLMEDQLEAIIGSRGCEEGPKRTQVRLLAASLRGSPLAAGVQVLSSREAEIEIVDHMGPRHKVFEEYRLGPLNAGGEYIYVGDFTIGGTELRVAQAYAVAHGARLSDAIVLGCALSPDQYGAPPRVRPLVTLPECCPEGKYEFVAQ